MARDKPADEHPRRNHETCTSVEAQDSNSRPRGIVGQMLGQCLRAGKTTYLPDSLVFPQLREPKFRYIKHELDFESLIVRISTEVEFNIINVR